MHKLGDSVYVVDMRDGAEVFRGRVVGFQEEYVRVAGRFTDEAFPRASAYPETSICVPPRCVFHSL